MFQRHLTWLSALCCSLLLLPLPGAAQRDIEAAFGEAIDVRVVNLEIVVVDGQGNRVPGLTAADFRLEVDGRELPIGYFTEVQDGRAAATEGKEQAAVPGVEPGAAVSTSYLLFIDDLFSFAEHRNRVLATIAEQLDALGSQDRMAVVAYNGKKLDMLTTWEGSKDRLRRTLAQASQRPAHGAVTLQAPIREALQAQEQIVDEILQFANQGTLTGSSAGIATMDTGNRLLHSQNAIGRLHGSLERVTTAAAASLRSFAKAPGRKVLVLLAGGWPYSPMEFLVGDGSLLDLAQTPGGPVIENSKKQGAQLIGRIYDTANILGYTIYPVDLPGLTNIAENFTADTVGSFGSSDQERQMHSTLSELSDRTGGRALIDNARLTSFERVVQDTRSYYWLGFSPDWQGDDEEHRIEIEVLRPGLEARYRDAFRDLSKEQEVSFMVESALLVGELPGAQPLDVKLGATGKARRGRVSLPLEVVIPMDIVTMLPHDGQFVARLELHVAALDERGQRTELPTIPIVLGGPKPPAPGQFAVYETAIKLRNQSHDLVLALRDPLSGTILSTVREFAPQ